ncbi:hypothetical protein CP02DC22_1254, partial [Chlamydia psittaci 02DC22]
NINNYINNYYYY